MTQRLQELVDLLTAMPDEAQDEFADRAIAELADEAKWDATFAFTADALDRWAEKVERDIDAGKFEPGGFDGK